MKLLLSGLDTVECAYYLHQVGKSAFDFTTLTERREALRAAKRRDPCVVELGGKEFLVGRGGTASGYPLVLDNAEQTIQCGEFNSPSFFVTYRSQALWHKGARQLHDEFRQWAEALALKQIRSEGLSRVDFTLDVHLPLIDFDEDSFVTLASKDGKHRKDRKVQTLLQVQHPNWAEHRRLLDAGRANGQARCLGLDGSGRQGADACAAEGDAARAEGTPQGGARRPGRPGARAAARAGVVGAGNESTL